MEVLELDLGNFFDKLGKAKDEEESIKKLAPISHKQIRASRYIAYYLFLPISNQWANLIS